MSAATLMSHRVMQMVCARKARRFNQQLAQCQQTQAAAFARILRSLTGASHWTSKVGRWQSSKNPLEEARADLPVVGYGHFAGLIDEQRRTRQALLAPSIVRFEPTSGSQSDRKWIPYSREFLREIGFAAGSWIHDIYQTYPEIKSGRHYWSLSWTPQELRGQLQTDDTQLFPWHERFLLAQTMAAPSSIGQIEMATEAWQVTLLALADCPDLSFISVWSPTFLLKILHDLREQWPKLRSKLKRSDLARIDWSSSDVCRNLWPRLRLVSCWDSWTSAGYAAELQSALQTCVEIQGKGLWSTEGVVTIPYRGKKVLATNSHVFEFRDLGSGHIRLAHELEMNHIYQPILWTSTGLLRYETQDQVRMSGWLEQTPCLDFVGRIHGVDLVGEKMDVSLVEKIRAQFADQGFLCLLAIESPTPHYAAVLTPGSSLTAEMIDRACLAFHHYALARELGQLQPMRVIRSHSHLELWDRIGVAMSGQRKPELLMQFKEWPEVP